MMSRSKSKRSLPRAKLLSEALRERMGAKRYNQWLKDTEQWSEFKLDEFLSASMRSRSGSTK